MFNWVICRFQKYWNFQSEAKVEQTTAIVTTRSVSCFICFCNILIHFFTSEKNNLHGIWVTSPSPKFTSFPVMTTLQELNLSALRKQIIVLANLPDFPSSKCPTVLSSFFTWTAYLFSGLSGFRWLYKHCSKTLSQRFW